MSKYSFELKLKIVQEYLVGKGGIQALANKHGVKAAEQVHRWINAYQEFGEEGLYENVKIRIILFNSS